MHLFLWRPRGRAPRLLLAALALSISATGPALASAADRMVETRPEAERPLLREVLARNPDLARARHQAEAARARVDQAGALSDPTASVKLFLLPPETRVGPQRFSISAGQRLPWRGTRRLKADAVRHAAEAMRAEADALGLTLVTEARTILAEIAFVDARRAILEEERQHLDRHEEVARARYEAGNGPQQGVVRLQSAITLREQNLLDLALRRASLLAALNQLRDAPADAPALPPPLDPPPPVDLDLRRLVAEGQAHRPEIRAADARAAQARVGVALAERRVRPDVTLGIGYTAVESRQDRAGRINPPAGNGDDILAVTASVALPVRRRPIAAAIFEQQALVLAAEQAKRAASASIARQVGDHAARLPLLFAQHELLTGVLGVQAEEAWRSAEIGYATGELGALDLLDAEHLLFEVRTTAARTAADFIIAHARLEQAVGGLVDLAMEIDHAP